LFAPSSTTWRVLSSFTTTAEIPLNLIVMVLMPLSYTGISFVFICVFQLGMFLCNCNSNQSKNCNCRLPVPRQGQVLGLVGANGIGKSTALKILAGQLKPNLGRFTVRTTKLAQLLIVDKHVWVFIAFLFNFSFPLQDPPDWEEISIFFRGSELHNYFTGILEDGFKVMFMSLFNPKI
jgi:hypothetical protein